MRNMNLLIECGLVQIYGCRLVWSICLGITQSSKRIKWLPARFEYIYMRHIEFYNNNNSSSKNKTLAKIYNLFWDFWLTLWLLTILEFMGSLDRFKYTFAIIAVNSILVFFSFEGESHHATISLSNGRICSIVCLLDKYVSMSGCRPSSD